jgi:ribosomal protein S18 acetylase RimI-like enzyme
MAWQKNPCFAKPTQRPRTFTVGSRKHSLPFSKKAPIQPMIALRPAQAADCALLAQMNKHLIEDEGSRNPMAIHQLEQRMQTWLARGDYRIELVLNPEPIGYIIYRITPDEYFPQKQQVYLRQFFIERGFRRQGLGQAAIKLWMSRRVPNGSRVMLEVLASNQNGLAFWRRLGFGDYALTLVLTT